MPSRTVELRLRVRYERDDSQRPTEEECRAPLADVVEHAALSCLLSGDAEHLLVEHYRYDIQTIGID